MQLGMFERRVVFANEFGADFPESIVAGELHLAGEAVDRSRVTSQEYDKQSAHAQNDRGHENGQVLQMNIENAEKRIGLLARFATLH